MRLSSGRHLRHKRAQDSWQTAQHNLKAIQQVTKALSSHILFALHVHVLQSELLADFLDVITDVVKRGNLLFAWQRRPHTSQ